MAIVLDGTNGVTTNSGTLISATTIGVGGATPSTSGAGITFPATQSASTNANTLDDYEEGGFTPILGAASSNPTVTYSANIGTYTKIGRMVMIQCYVETTARSGGSGSVRITGLPFVPDNNSNSYAGVMASQAGNITGVSYLGVRPVANQSYLQLMVNGTDVILDISNWTASGYFLVTLSYIV